MKSHFVQRLQAFILTCLLALSGVLVPSVASAHDQSLAGQATINWKGGTQVGFGWTGPWISHAFAAGDLDGNGIDDMLVTDTSGQLWFYPTTSPTTFAKKRLVGNGWASMYAIFGGVDVNGDGRVDILGIDNSGVLYLYPGTGRGTFSKKQKISEGWKNVTALSVGKTGRNGNPTIAGIHNGTLYLWPTDGAGRVLSPTNYGSGFDDIKTTALTIDIDSNGAPDMWALATNGDLRAYLMSSDGSSLSFYRAGWGWESATHFLPLSNGTTIRAIFGPGPFADGDLRQYNLSSVSVLTPGTPLPASTQLPGVLAGTITPAAPTPPPRPTLWPDLSARAAQIGSGWPTSGVYGLGDLNSNRISDIGLIDSAGRFFFYSGVSTTSFASRLQIGNGWGSFLSVHTGVDFDGDGRMDVVTVSRDGQLSLYTGKGDATFGSPRSIGRGFATFAQVFVLRNGPNAHPVIYGVKRDGSLFMYRTGGTGTITSSAQVRGNYSHLIGAFVMDDMDKDGRSDVVKIESNGELSLHRQLGGGGFESRKVIGFGWSPFKRLTTCDANATSTCLFAVRSDGKLFRYDFAYRGANRGFVPIKVSTPAYDVTSAQVLVNKRNPLKPIGYVPANLVSVSSYGIPVEYANTIRRDAAVALQRMHRAARSAGHNFGVRSGYRSYLTQSTLYAGYVSQDGRAAADRYSARAGYSEHQTGLAVDLYSPGSRFTQFGSTASGRWVAANAWRYGYIMRYPSGAEHITGFMHESWHFRYVGVEVSTAMHNRGITTYEQYLGVPAAPSY